MCNIHNPVWIESLTYQLGVWFKVYCPKMYTMYIIRCIIMLELTEISKIVFIFTGLISFMHFFWHFAEEVPQVVCSVLFLYDFLCQLMRQNVPRAALPNSLSSKVQEFLSCVNSLTPTEVLFLGKDFSTVITVLPDMSSLMVRDLRSSGRVYLSPKGFPSLCIHTMSHSIHLSAI